MIDEKYPGFDLNPLISISDFFQQGTIMKLFEVGIGHIHELQQVSIEEVKVRAGLSDDEYKEIQNILSMFAVKKIHK